MQPAHYVEHQRLVLWDKAFCVYFDEKREFKLTKGLNFMEFQEGPIAIYQPKVSTLPYVLVRVVIWN